METFQKATLIFTVIGAINWGLIGIIDVDLVALIFGEMSLFSRIIYTLVGICGIVNIGILLAHLDFRED